MGVAWVVRRADRRASRAGQGPSPLSGRTGHGSEPGALAGDRDCVGPAGGFPFRAVSPGPSRAPSFLGLTGCLLPPLTAADQADAARGPCPASLHAGAFGAGERRSPHPRTSAATSRLLIFSNMASRAQGLKKASVCARVCACVPQCRIL